MNESDDRANGRENRGRSPLDRLLSLFTEVKGGEGLTAVLLMLNAFLLLLAYYVVKPLREALILGGAGAEVKAYASAGQALLLLVLIPAYGRFASRVNRARLITWVTLFFISNLAVFYALATADMPGVGVAFFLWVGIFNVMIVAQFWAFANDVYSPERGKRLFALVAFGASAGAIAGTVVVEPIIEELGIGVPMLVAAAVLGVCILLTLVLHRREPVAFDAGGRAVDEKRPLGREGGFQLVFRQRYLLLIALLILVYNSVNTTGEYILGRAVGAQADRLIATGAAGGLPAEDWKERYIGLFYANFFFWVNILSAALQLFVVSRIFKWFGVRVALFFLPIIALGGYTLLAVAPVLQWVRAVKIAENATDYSIQNTTRHALFLPTSREAKYKAKAAIDSFFWRMGDVVSALLVFVGTTWLELSTQGFAAVNLGLVLLWLGLAVAIASRHRGIERAPEREPAPVPA